MSDTPRTRLGRMLNDAAAADIPESLDLWPAIAAAARSRGSATAAKSDDTTQRNAWSGPAIDPAARRRAARQTTESAGAAGQKVENTASDTTGDDLIPLPLPRQPWTREALKLVAAALVFILVGTILALALRDEDDIPAIGGPGPTPTPVVTPSPIATEASRSDPTATIAAVAATPTGALQPSPTPSEPVPTPLVMGQVADDLPTAGQIAATIPVGVSPLSIASGHGAIWVYNDIDGTVVRINPASGEVVATIQVAAPRDPAFSANDLPGLRGASPDLAIDATSVWAIAPEEQAVVRIDPQTNAVVATIALEAKAFAIVSDGSSLWVALFGIDSVARIDTATGEMLATVRNVTSPASIAVTQDAIWVTNLMSNAVTRIDPTTNEIVARVSMIWPGSPIGDLSIVDPVCGFCTREIMANEHGIWVSLPSVGFVVRIDAASNQLVAVVPVGGQPRSLASDARGVWVGHLSSTGILLIDPTSNQVVAAVPVPEPPNQAAWITFHEGALWVTRVPTNDVARIELQAQ